MSAADDALEISILGPVRARLDGVDVALGGRRQQAVLARLALSGSSAVSAERLVDDLWGDAPPATAVNTLQSYVSNLRRLLGSTTPPVIERVGDGYRLRLDEGALVAPRFERLVTEATAAGTGPQRRVELLGAALDLWHGPALGDLADEPWAQGDAVRLEELRLAAVEARFQAHLDAAGHALVVGDLEAAVRADPLRERLTHLLVLALYRCGRQAEALRAYERTRSHLAEELGLDPGPDLVRLAAAVAAQDPALDAPDEPAPEAAGATGSGETGSATVLGREGGPRTAMPDGVVLPLPPAVAERRARSGFVGRGRQLEVLEGAWAAVASPQAASRLVTLAGEPGVGKTRLAQHLARTVHEAGGQVLWGRCSAEQLVAYQPVVEAIRTALRSLGPGVARALAAARPALAPLLPDDVAAAVPGGRAERYELFESLAELIGDVASGSPVLLVIDDLQWADASTLALLDHLLHHARTERLLVVATLRRPAGRPTSEVDRFLTDLRRAHRFEHVDVGGFDAEEVAALLAAQGIAVEPEVADAVQARTGGNPFFVESLAEGGGDLAGGDPRSVPASVREVLDQRLAQLDPDTARVLTAASVVGLRVELDLLTAVADADLGQVLDVVDDAVATGLLTEDEELGWVAFPHALVRQALVARLSRNREALLHLRVADAVEARPAVADRATVVAQHLIAAGRACPPARAARAAATAGQEALAVVADEEALIWADRALTALATVAAVEDPELVDLRIDAHLLAARAARHLGDLVRARAEIDEVVDLSRRHGDSCGLAHGAQETAMLSGAVGLSFSGVDEALTSLLREALDALGDTEPGERAALLAWSSIAMNGGDDRDGQERLSVEALEAAALVPTERHVQALALLARRMAVGGPPGVDERLSLIAPLQEAAAGWTDLEITARIFAVNDLLEADRSEDAEALLEETATLVAPIGRPALEAYVLFFQCMFAGLHGELDRARELSDRALTIGLPAHGQNALGAWGAQQFMLADAGGTLTTLTDQLRQLADDEPLVPAWRMAYARCLVAEGDVEGARREAHTYLEGGRLRVDRRSVLREIVAGLAAEVCWLIDDIELAEALVVELAPIAHRIGTSGLAAATVGPLLRHQGLALAVTGDLDAAEAQLALAAARCHECRFLISEAEALAERAVVLRRRGGPGDLEEAERCAAESDAICEQHGFVLDLPPD
ncbi:MAG TPA: BTAD domain-containing putative transcriptional regulator [Aquihabitans sp.]|nr:BTAD domain-containing putative transcriptional regulator [Aquihabitans sp.]